MQSYRHADPRRQWPQVAQHKVTGQPLESLATMRRGGFRNHVNLTTNILTTGSMHAERVLQSICVPSLVLIAQAIFHGHTLQTSKCD